ncbi:probable ATP-dependent RNA helicase ddx42 [Fopius arisanus]|uniref:Probable ATP-dependent RNA helicase ddx42 n=1 Tax=Fopius arisanus TaxID=64838 RepID=A0A0C9R8D9_9HYME|nr:PREDICTED: probable ATP-dependent RNA helicase ddx42 [Fopius arisanus]
MVSNNLFIVLLACTLINAVPIQKIVRNNRAILRHLEVYDENVNTVQENLEDLGTTTKSTDKNSEEPTQATLNPFPTLPGFNEHVKQNSSTGIPNGNSNQPWNQSTEQSKIQDLDGKSNVGIQSSGPSDKNLQNNSSNSTDNESEDDFEWDRIFDDDNDEEQDPLAAFLEEVGVAVIETLFEYRKKIRYGIRGLMHAAKDIVRSGQLDDSALI